MNDRINKWYVAALSVLARRDRDERAASLIEYAFLVALIAVVCLVAITYFGTQTSHKFSSVGSAIGTAG